MDNKPLDTPRDVTFRKSSHSAQEGNCIEIGGATDGGRWLRDSKNPHSPAHYFTADEWDAFVRGVKDGTFD